MIRKMDRFGIRRPTTWLVSREMTQAAGSWDTRFTFDDDGEYFSAGTSWRAMVPGLCRTRKRSIATRFSPVTSVSPTKEIGIPLPSMQLHVDYIRSLEDSERPSGMFELLGNDGFSDFTRRTVGFVEQLQRARGDPWRQIAIPRNYPGNTSDGCENFRLEINPTHSAALQ